MALGFIKKIFYFGKTEEELKSGEEPKPGEVAEVVQPVPADTPAAPPVELPAGPELQPSIPEPFTQPDVAPGQPEEVPVEPVPVEPEVPEPEPDVVPEPEPEPVEVPAAPEPVKPELAPVEVPPAPVEPETQRLPSEVPTVAPEQPKDEPAERQAPAKVTVSRAVEAKAADAPTEAAPPPRLSWYQRLSQGLSRSSRDLRDSIASVFTKRKLDEDTLQDLEDVLLRADLGMETAIRVTDALSSGRFGKEISGEEVRSVMAQEIEKVLAPVAKPLELDLSHKPHVVLVVGVNGTGKTTTIGKLAAKLTAGGLKVTLAAGDTFRAAAIEQLKIWGERTGSPVVSSKLGADAAGLAYDAYEKAKAAGSDVLIIDTAGRLQNKAELMAELEKVVRVLGKHDPEAPHTVLQTVDATTGQNALNQVEIFRNVAGVNGLVMTKLDGTARGGILVAIAAKHKLPVYFIGVGEQVDDLEPFSAGDFAKAIAGVN